MRRCLDSRLNFNNESLETSQNLDFRLDSFKAFYSWMEVSSEISIDGNLFVEFIALIYLPYFKKTIQEKNLFKSYTRQEPLDEFDVIEGFEQPGHELSLGEITKRQMELYENMGMQEKG